MADINREQFDILEKFFGECLRYWERELKVSSDLDKQPFINAIRDIPTHNPYKMQGELLDAETVKQFKKYRYMDCYGKDWEKYYTE